MKEITIFGRGGQGAITGAQLLATAAFGLVFRGLGGDQMVREFLQGIGGGSGEC